MADTPRIRLTPASAQSDDDAPGASAVRNEATSSAPASSERRPGRLGAGLMQEYTCRIGHGYRLLGLQVVIMVVLFAWVLQEPKGTRTIVLLLAPLICTVLGWSYATNQLAMTRIVDVLLASGTLGGVYQRFRLVEPLRPGRVVAQFLVDVLAFVGLGFVALGLFVAFDGLLHGDLGGVDPEPIVSANVAMLIIPAAALVTFSFWPAFSRRRT